MEFFLEQIQTLLPVLGFDFLRVRPKPTATTAATRDGAAATSSPIFIGDIPKCGITSHGQQIDGEFVVFNGSRARRHWEAVVSGRSANGRLHRILEGTAKTYGQRAE